MAFGKLYGLWPWDNVDSVESRCVRFHVQLPKIIVVSIALIENTRHYYQVNSGRGRTNRSENGRESNSPVTSRMDIIER